MNKTTFTLLACALALVGAFFLGRMSVEEIVRTVQADVNIDSLKNLFVPGKESSVSLQTLIEANADLRNLLAAERRKNPNRYKELFIHDTLWIPPDQDHVQTHMMDTTGDVHYEVSSIDGEDTTIARGTTKMNVQVVFLGEPLNSFWLTSASIDPFRIERSIVERSRGDGGYLFGIRGIGVGGGDVGLGAQLEIGRVGFGALFMAETKPLYMLNYRIFEF